MNQPQYARNFDYFRVSHSKEKIGVAVMTLRKWAKAEDGPTFIKMKGEQIVWARYSEVEQYIATHSEQLKAA